MGKNSGLVANKLYPIELLVKNKGYALQNDYYQINFLPVITWISNNQGRFFNKILKHELIYSFDFLNTKCKKALLQVAL